MKSLWLASSMLVVSLAIGDPVPVFAHVGHGDEFQAEGGINRVAVNTETDSLMGIEVNPIEPAPDGSAAVLIPVTALVDDAGKQLVFVQYESFYEPVPVTTGATQGELIEVTQGLSVGETLVTQGSLSLYAESRKTQTANAVASPEAVTSPQTDVTHAQADAQGIPHSHDASGNLVQSGETASPSSEVSQQTSETSPSQGFPMGMLAAVGGGAVLLVGAIAFGSRKKKSTFSNK
ncbi:MAG TPA: cobalt transporter [Allocoleopsis sp.]